MDAELFPFPILVGDIGGTNARFAIVEDAHANPKSFDPVPTANYPDLESAIEDAVLAKTNIIPKAAAIAIAAPVDGDAVDLTNAHWVIKPRDAIAQLDLIEMILLNDFEALALALVSLDEDELVAIGGGQPDDLGTKAVLGPGTGLGVAGLLRNSGRWLPIPGEGGHVSVGPVEADEFEIWPNIEREYGRISAESLLAGRGIVRLYDAVCATRGEDPRLTDPAAVTTAALDGGNAAALETIQLYCRLLGRIAGDVALTFMALGGVYIGGGIVPRLLPLLENSEFRMAFEDKAPHGAALKGIQTAVIIADRPALTGIATFARTPALFGVSLEGRRWTR